MSDFFIKEVDLTVNSDQNPTDFIYIDPTTDEIVMIDKDNITELFRFGGGTAMIPVIKAANAKADFATAEYIAYVIGQQVASSDYAASGDGGVFEKVSSLNNDFNDWVVVATENAASTGTIGANPA